MAKIRLGSFEVFYQDSQTETFPLLFLHGWGASSRFWREIFPLLNQQYRCLAFDLPGFGASDRPYDFDYTISSYAHVVNAFLDALAIEKVAVVGHSMGGAIALQWALQNRTRVHQLVLVSAIVDGPSAFSFRQGLLMLPGIGALTYGLLHLAVVRRYFARRVLYRPFQDDLVDDLVRGSYRAMTQSARALRRWSLLDKLPELNSVPTLLIASPFDRVVPFQQSELLARHIPQAQFEHFEKSIHCPMLEEPDRFARVISNFLPTR